MKVTILHPHQQIIACPWERKLVLWENSQKTCKGLNHKIYYLISLHLKID